jgi:predicted DNA-binding transcriptional regulator YafY
MSIYFLCVLLKGVLVVEEQAGLKWGVERRLEFIEFRLFWEDGIRRSDLIKTFGVSEPQASKDLTLYQERAPGNAVYDKVSKRYVAGSDFAPVFLKAEPMEYLGRLRSLGEELVSPAESWLGSHPEIDIALSPAREVESDCLRAVLKAVREDKSIEVKYQSMSKDRPDPLWRRITPHSFGYDGFRWHVRAYCHPTDKFKDFLIPRIIGVRAFEAAGKKKTEDKIWNERFGIVIGPHPDLGPNQKAIVAKDYGMRNGSTVLEVRYAMLFYVLKRLGLQDNPETKSARAQHIVLLNKEETKEALNASDWSL